MSQSNEAEGTPLTPAEARFVAEFMLDPTSAARAYRAAYPESSEAAARVGASRMKTRPHVAAAIRAAREAQARRTNVRADSVLRELVMIATSDAAELYDPRSNLLRHPRHIPISTRRCIASMKVRRIREETRDDETVISEEIVEIQFADKIAALDRLARHLGLDTEITPLEALFEIMPKELGAAVRAALTAPPRPQEPQLPHPRREDYPVGGRR